MIEELTSQLLLLWNTSGLGFQVVLAFAAGLLTSFTPCVYPLIPITIALFSQGNQGQSRPSIMLALSYCFGLCLCYTALGLITALGGGIFGQYLGSKFLMLFLAGLLVVMAAQTLELIRFRFLDRLQNLGGKFQLRQSKLGMLAAGALSGLIAAPCVGPVLVLILSQAATAGSPISGAALLFSFSLGLCVLFLGIALFSGLGRLLPRAGNWFTFIKYLIATALLLTAVYFFRLTAPEVRDLLPKLGACISVMLGVLALGLLYLATKKTSQALMAVSSLILSLVIALQIWGNSTAQKIDTASPVNKTQEQKEITWSNDFSASLALARELNRPLIVDLYADWCLACAELDEKVLKETKVAAALNDFIRVRLDFTTDSDFSADFSKRYKVVGLPCILFLTPEGIEIAETRVTGLVSPQEFIAQIGKAISAIK
jgi:thioredoxin:protein disulfide reductase